MNTYSQNGEDLIVKKYFDGYKGSILSIGENDGSTLSNTLLLIEDGWEAILVEPSPLVYPILHRRHISNKNISCINAAVSDFNGEAKFYQSGEHLGKGDLSLLSTLHEKEKNRWVKEEFTEVLVNVLDFNSLIRMSPIKRFDFISIDAEGDDLKILFQMNLNLLQCKCICIEYNSNEQTLNEIKKYCAYYNIQNEILKNAENVILTKY